MESFVLEFVGLFLALVGVVFLLCTAAMGFAVLHLLSPRAWEPAKPWWAYHEPEKGSDSPRKATQHGG